MSEEMARLAATGQRDPRQLLESGADPAVAHALIRIEERLEDGAGDIAEFKRHVDDCGERSLRVEGRLSALEAKVGVLLDSVRAQKAALWTLAGAGLLVGGGMVVALFRLVGAITGGP